MVSLVFVLKFVIIVQLFYGEIILKSYYELILCAFIKFFIIKALAQESVNPCFE